MAAPSAPPADAGSLTADQLARVPNVTVTANELATQATRVEATGELMVLRANSPTTGTAIVFLLCGNWSYPLVEGVAVLVDNGRYVLPTDKGITFLVDPQEATPAELAQFSAVLADHAEVRALAQPPPAPQAVVAAGGPPVETEEVSEGKRKWGDTVASGVSTVGTFAARGLVTGAVVAGIGISRAGAFIKSRVTPKEEEVEVSQDTKERLEKAKVISQAAMHVTGGLISGVTEVAMTLGSAVVGAVKDTSVGVKMREGAASSTGQEVMKVAGAGVHAFTNIWTALEESARTVGRATAEATTDVVRHKYGADAAEATKDGFSAAGAAALSVFHVTNLGATAVATYTSAHGDKESLVSRRELREVQASHALKDAGGHK